MGNKAEQYDVIVVGGRCAGAPTAMLLAQQGHRVLVLEKDSYPSDKLSTHFIHPPGVAALKRWGVLEDILATGCPPIRSYKFDFGAFAIQGSPQPYKGVDMALGPRRKVADRALAQKAADAGAEIRENFIVEELVFEGDRLAGIRGREKGGESVTERARVVVGADGLRSKVAEGVGAEVYEHRGTHSAWYYAYWSGLDAEGFELYLRPGESGRGIAVVPTNDDLYCVPVAWPNSEFKQNRSDIEGNYMASIDLAPDLAERVRRGKRESRFFGTADLPNQLRTPFGDGWALVGDAGYHKDPCTAQGISDAFCHAELLAGELGKALAGEKSFRDAMETYQETRDANVQPMLQLTADLATLAPPPQEQLELFGALHGNQEATDAFVSTYAGTKPVPEFFAAENIQRIMNQKEASASP